MTPSRSHASRRPSLRRPLAIGSTALIFAVTGCPPQEPQGPPPDPTPHTFDVRIWGENQFGTVGDGTTTPHLAPDQKAVPPALPAPGQWTDVALGTTGNVSAVDANGGLWGWGFNGYGALGDGTQTNHPSPTAIGTSHDWAKVSTAAHTIALQKDGTLWVWGLNLGNLLSPETGTGLSLVTPVPVGTDHDWVSIHAGYLDSLAIKADGSLWAWGYNEHGQLGDGTTTSHNLPRRVGTANDWTGATLAGTQGGHVAVKADGSLWAWGYNDRGQLGDGTTTDRLVPTRIGTANDWRDVSADRQTLAVKSDGTLWAWGLNANGQLGDGTQTDRSAPTRIGTGTTWRHVAAGSATSHGVRSDGTLWSWGESTYGELGNGTFTNGVDVARKLTPVRIGATRRWEAIVAGGDNALGVSSAPLASTTTVLTSSKNPSFTFEPVTFRATVVPVAPATGTPTGTVTFLNGTTVLGSMALSGGVATLTTSAMPEGTFDIVARYSGDTDFLESTGQLSQVSRLRPTTTTLTADPPPSYHNANLTFTATVAAVAPASGTPTGLVAFDEGTTRLATVSLSNGQASFTTNTLSTGSHTITATLQAGGQWAPSSGSLTRPITIGPNLATWGLDSVGQLGIGTQNAGPYQPAPARIGTSPDWTSVSVTTTHAVALRADGTLWAWGYAGTGIAGAEVGTPATTLTVPTQVGTDRWKSVTAGYESTIGVKADGSLWVWGNNAEYLGCGCADGAVPRRVGTDNDWAVAATAGITTTSYAVAIKTNGTLWTWGNNYLGTLGISGLVSSATPRQVGGAVNWNKVAASEDFVLATRTDGSLWSWGSNSFGQLGLGAVTGAAAPTRVGDATNWATPYAASGALTTKFGAATKTDGSLWTWGWNNHGQLGDGTHTNRNTPARVGTSTWTMVSLTEGSVRGVRTDGSLWGWGYDSGDIVPGPGIHPEVLTPTRIGTENYWQSVSADAPARESQTGRFAGVLRR